MTLIFRSSFDLRRLLCIGLWIPLTACGGGGGAGGDGNPVVTPYDDIVGAYGVLSEEFPFADVTDRAQIPDSGAPRYDGYVIIDIPDDQAAVTGGISGIAGRLSITVTFDDSTFDGFAHDLHSDSGGSMTVVDDNADPVPSNQIDFDGGFDLGAGASSPDDPIIFDLVGNLQDQSGVVVGLDLGMTGDFVGTDAAAINGNVGGVGSVDGTPIVGRIVGGFVARK